MSLSREALYRRYRPRRFREVVGQDAEVRLLTEAVRSGQVSHAYLLAGPRGTGKTSVARILAQAVTCEAPLDGEPCGECASCHAVEAHRHLDIVEIDGASNRGIDEVRDLREMVLHAPAMGRRKVYIVDEVHMLTEPAFNAFLKTLEEPPPHVVFIFATTEPHKVPITVLSRCQRYDFHRIDQALIVRQLGRILEQEGAGFDAASLERIAEASDGGLRDAESLLDQVLAGGEVSVARVEDVLGALDQNQLRRLADAMRAGLLGDVLVLVDELYQAGRDPRQMLRDVARRLRDAWAAEVLGDAPAGRGGADAWFRALDALAETEGRLRGAFPPRLVIELGLLKAAQALGGSSEAREAAPSSTLHGTTSLAAARRALQETKPEVDNAPTAPREESGGDAGVTPPRVPRGAPRPKESPPRDEAPPAGPPSAPEVKEAVAPPSGGVVQLETVVDRLRKRRQLTAALFRHARAEERGDTVAIRFRYPAHYAILDDERSGHRQAFLECFREVYGDRPVVFAVDDGDEPPRDPEGPVERIRRVFGPDAPITVVGDPAESS